MFKIGDMPDEASTACVKVVASKDDKDIEDSNTRGKGNFVCASYVYFQLCFKN